MLAYEIDVFGWVVGRDIVDGSVLNACHLHKLKHLLAVLASAEPHVVAELRLHKKGEFLTLADEGDAGFNLAFQFLCHCPGLWLCVQQSPQPCSR